MVKPVDQNQLIQIKTILLYTENPKYLDIIKGFFFFYNGTKHTWTTMSAEYKNFTQKQAL